jgi:hypothetical protein
LKHLAEAYLRTRNTNVQATMTTAPAASNPLSQAVLVAMRDTLGTDAAMIQARDLYDADNLSMEGISAREVQDQIDRVVWKGDEAIVIHVTGATIRKLLKQSTTFSQLDKNSLNTEIETGRQLVTLGIYGDAKDPDVYYINGSVMSDTGLYSVATSDFISGGDTGYSNLVPPDVLPADRVRHFAKEHVNAIAGLVCQGLESSSGRKDIGCAPLKVGSDYFDTSHELPSDTTPGYDTAQRYNPRGFFGNFRRVFLPPRRPFANSEQDVQQRPFFYVSLTSLDFSETGAFIDHFSRTEPRLAGISNPLVANKGTQNIGADHKARAVFDYRVGTLYFQSDSSFLYSNTVSYTPSSMSPGPPSQQVVNGPPALTYNILGFEGGGTFRLSPNGNRVGIQETTPRKFGRPSWLSLQYALRYERQLVHPINTQASLSPPPTIADTSASFVSNLQLQTPRLTTDYYRIGLRAENADTYLEMGVEEIDSRHLLSSYTISEPNGTITCKPTVMNYALSCFVPAALSFATPMVDQMNVPPSNLMLPGPRNLLVPASTYSKRDPGAYLNFYWKFPLWSKRDANRADQSWYLTFTNKGDVYFNSPGDTMVQTRYLDKFTPGFVIPLWAGLSLTPKVDFILYQNKIVGTPFWAAQPSFSLSYTFLWRQGMGPLRALRYGAQTTTPSTAGTSH